MSANPHEAAARVRKAMAIASYVRDKWIGPDPDEDFTLADVVSMDHEAWTLLAQTVGYQTISDATVASVIAILKSREEEAQSKVSPLAGLTAERN